MNKLIKTYNMSCLNKTITETEQKAINKVFKILEKLNDNQRNTLFKVLLYHYNTDGEYINELDELDNYCDNPYCLNGGCDGGCGGGENE